jgi:hypothetical protein
MIKTLRYSKFLGVLFLVFLLPEMLMARGPRPPDPPKIVQAGDIHIWDDQYLSGYEKKGWIIPANYNEIHGKHSYWQGIKNALRYGRFGLKSGRHVYSTWRSIVPLSNEQYAEGKESIFDVHTSNLVMPAFEVKLDYITFLLSGGYAPNEACLNLLFDGKVVRSATGRNDDFFEMVAFDVKEFKGKKVQIQVLDKSSAHFAYVTVDCVYQSLNSKKAVRVIRSAPTIQKMTSLVETTSSKHTGVAVLKDSTLSLNGKKVDWNSLLTCYTGAKAGNANAKRIELINGDSIVTEVENLEDGKLKFKHAILGELSLDLSKVAQVKFKHGPSVNAKPGTLIHMKGNKIPGELSWIRKDNISIKCALGQLPLPRSRVNAFVFNAKKTVNADLLVLTDGSRLSGKISLDNDQLVLTHSALGPIKLKLEQIVQITLHKTGIISLSDLKSKIIEKVGPLTPPDPILLKSGSQNLLRIFPRTVVRFDLPKSQSSRRFRGLLKPVINCSTKIVVVLRSGSSKQEFIVEPDSEGIAIDFDLKMGNDLEMIVETKSAASYPSGIEWHKATIIEDIK